MLSTLKSQYFFISFSKTNPHQTPPHPDDFYDNVDYLEKQGISELNIKIRSRCNNNKDILQQIDIYDDAIELEDENQNNNNAGGGGSETSYSQSNLSKSFNENDFEDDVLKPPDPGLLGSAGSANGFPNGFAKERTSKQNQKARRSSISTNDIWRTSIRKMKAQGLIPGQFKFEKEKVTKDHAREKLDQKNKEEKEKRENGDDDRMKTLAERENEYRREKAKEANRNIKENTRDMLKRKKDLMKNVTGAFLGVK